MNQSMRLKARIKAMALKHRVLAEKIETILRRGALNARLRDFYDVYILAKTQSQFINRQIFAAALHATAQKRESLAALQEKGKILSALLSDMEMKQRWERYAKDNYYAAAIEFDEAVGVIMEWVGL